MKAEFVRGIAKIRDNVLVLLDIFKVLSTAPEIPIKE
jgi:chemotaxis signal transduction protein